MPYGSISDDQASQYRDKGYVLAKGFFDRAEIELLRRAAKEERELDQHSFARADGEGGQVRLSAMESSGRHDLWNVCAM